MRQHASSKSQNVGKNEITIITEIQSMCSKTEGEINASHGLS